MARDVTPNEKGTCALQVPSSCEAIAAGGTYVATVATSEAFASNA